MNNNLSDEMKKTKRKFDLLLQKAGLKDYLKADPRQWILHLIETDNQGEIDYHLLKDIKEFICKNKKNDKNQ